MQTPDEIKKGLESCSADECHGDHVGCPYITSTMCIMDMANDALAYINQLEQRLASVGKTCPEWIKVGAEKKPMHGKEYLCWCTLPDDPLHRWDWMMVLRYYAYGSNGYVDRPHFTDEGANGMTVTHWMPLPEPPKEDEPS